MLIMITIRDIVVDEQLNFLGVFFGKLQFYFLNLSKSNYLHTYAKVF